MALDLANKTGDYSVLRGIGAPGFQANSVEEISRAFTGLREKEIDLSTIAVVNPRLNQEPTLGDVDGRPMMRVTGFFPGAAVMIDFDMVFEQVDGRWRLFGLSVNPTTRPSELPPTAPLVANGKPVIPQTQVMLALIRGAVLALNQANQTGNYGVLSKMSAPGFRQANSPARLSEIFTALRERDIDLSPVVVIDPGLYAAPAIMGNGMLRLIGYFPSEPERVNFDLAFQLLEGQWRLFGIGLNTSREVPAAAQLSSTSAPPPDAASQQQVTPHDVPLAPTELEGNLEPPGDLADGAPSLSQELVAPLPRLRPVPPKLEPVPQ
jgi:hypothetical protein